MKVFIIHSNYPEDHYSERADGIVAQHILKALGITADFRLALDRKRFAKAVRRAIREECDVLHVSTHGNDESIALCSDQRGSGQHEGLNWDEFVELFQGIHNAPTALVMSACCGASTALGDAFAAADRRPKIILGSSDDRRPADYVAAWALLYRAFRAQGIKRRVAQEALAGICATVHHNFRYLRWDDDRERYRQYPGAGKLFEVTERT